MNIKTTDKLGRRERKKRETRERILVTARDMFIRHGYEASTVEAIAEAAEVSKPTLFNYFASKAELLQAMLPWVDKRFAAALERQPSTGLTVRELLDAFFQEVAAMTRREPNLVRAMLQLTLDAYEDPRGRLAHHRFPATHAAFIRILDEGVAREEVRRDITTERIAHIITGVYVYGLLSWLIDPDYSLEQELREAVRFFAPALSGGT